MINNKSEMLELMLIKEVIDDFFDCFYNRPKLFGTVDQIEATFVIIDRINFILKYGSSIDKKEFSWTSFISYKGLSDRPNVSAIDAVKKVNDPYNALQKLRNEYNRWVDMKILHIDNPENSELVELLKKSNEREANELASWFAKYPSQKVINEYINRIGNDYFRNPHIAIALAKMGDKNILLWAIEQIDKKYSFEKRRIILKCIVSSPHSSANEKIRQLISSIQLGDINEIDDIECIAGFLPESANIKKNERLKQIIEIPGKTSTLKTILALSIRKLMDENKEEALYLLEKLEQKEENLTHIDL